MIGVDRRVVIEGVDVDEVEESIVVACRLRVNAKLRCGVCERRSGRYDHGEGRRRWRALAASLLQTDGTSNPAAPTNAPGARAAAPGGPAIGGSPEC